MKSAIISIAVIIILLVFMSQFFEALKPIASESSSAKQILDDTKTKSNLRWSEFPLNVYIDTSYIVNLPSYAEDAREAMRIWEERVDFISFRESGKSNADIVIKWVPKLKESSTDATGDSEVIFVDLGPFQVIKSSEIHLLTRFERTNLNSNDMINLVLHEIGHSIGLKHSDSETSIMFPTLEIPSDRVIPFSIEDIRNVEDLYELEAKADLRLAGSVNASKYEVTSLIQNRHFLNVSFRIENGGLKDALDVSYAVFANGNSIVNETAGKIEIGTSLQLTLSNIEVREDFDRIEIFIDKDNSIPELDEGDNMIEIEI